MVPTPDDLVAFAAARGVTATLHPADRPMPTVEAAAEALAIRPDEMTKNVLFFVARQPVLVIARGPSRVDRRALARHFGVGNKQVKLATPEQTLTTTGFEAGCVPPFGHLTPLPTLVDEAVLALLRVYGGTRDPCVLVSVPPEGLLALTAGTVLALALEPR